MTIFMILACVASIS